MSGCYSTFPPKLLANMGVAPANIENIITKTSNTVSYYKNVSSPERLTNIFTDARKCGYDVITETQNSVENEFDQFIIGTIVMIVVACILSIIMYRYLDYWPLYLIIVFFVIVGFAYLMNFFLRSAAENAADKAEDDLGVCYANAKTSFETYEIAQEKAIDDSLCYYASESTLPLPCSGKFAIQFCEDLGATNFGAAECAIKIAAASASYSSNKPGVKDLVSSAEFLATCSKNATEKKLTSTAENLATSLIVAAVLTIIMSFFISYAVGYEGDGVYEAIILSIIYISFITLIYMRMTYLNEMLSREFWKEMKICTEPFLRELSNYANAQEKAISTAFCAV